MQLVNKAHPLIAPGANVAKNVSSSFIRVSGKEVYFSAICCRQHDLHLGEYVEFFTVQNQWSFVKSIDKFVGFKLVAKTKYSLRVVNGALAKMILRSYKISSFDLEKTIDDYGGFPIIKMIRQFKN